MTTGSATRPVCVPSGRQPAASLEARPPSAVILVSEWSVVSGQSASSRPRRRRLDVLACDCDDKDSTTSASVVNFHVQMSVKNDHVTSDDQLTTVTCLCSVCTARQTTSTTVSQMSVVDASFPVQPDVQFLHGTDSRCTKILT